MDEAETAVADLKRLLSSAQEGQLLLPDFEQRFLSLYAALPSSVDAETASVLDEVFWAVEAYVPEDALRGQDELDELGLRRAIDTAMRDLRDGG